MILLDLLVFLAACIVLAKSGEYLVRSLSVIASVFGLTEFTIGFIIMAFATSIPELFVGVTSALSGNPALALGTVIGSNIADLTLVIGVTAILARGIRVESTLMRRDILYVVVITTLPPLLMIDQYISRFDALILLLAFVLYVSHLLKQKHEFRKKADGVSAWRVLDNMVLFVVFLIILFVSAEFVVKYATRLSADLLLPPIFIGLFMIALGTSLPELTVEVKAVTSGHKDIAIGDVLGSVVANSTLVLGITALICPIQANFLLFLTSAYFMIFVAVLFMTFVQSEEKLSLQEGITLLMLYILFILVEAGVHIIQMAG